MDDNSLPADAVPVDSNGVAVAQSVSVNPDAKPAAVQNIEQYKAIELTLPDGRLITMAPPTISLSKRLGVILRDCSYADDNMMQMERQRVRMLMYITHIDGAPKAMIADDMNREALEQELGDLFLDTLLMHWHKHFNFANIDLAVVKKY